ncbi:Serine/threonine-protein kinase OXI1 [Acorus calamus]|uniref:Serine/threonine-protein kinase OXI1 n=1 Tax=Acorus calamus TaxID=4465 RepID=A0AAV9EQ85_ACOCL|nr:Serine/threonine-protein kinase OXI1 [Acorus calamus]
MDPNLAGEPSPLRGLIRSLLEKDPRRRVSCGGIMGHEFFTGVDWELVLEMDRPPFIPGVDQELEKLGDVAGGGGIDVEGVVQSVFGGGDVDGNDGFSGL